MLCCIIYLSNTLFLNYDMQKELKSYWYFGTVMVFLHCWYNHFMCCTTHESIPRVYSHGGIPMTVTPALQLLPPLLVPHVLNIPLLWLWSVILCADVDSCNFSCEDVCGTCHLVASSNWQILMRSSSLRLDPFLCTVGMLSNLRHLLQ